MLLTVVCVFRPAWRWCCPGVVSAACSVLPAASLLTELCEPSPNGSDHIAPLLAFPVVLPSADAHITQTNDHWTAVYSKWSKKSMCFTYRLFLFYLFLLYLIFLELDDLLQALRRGSPIAAGANTRPSHHAQGGFGICSCQLALVIAVPFLATLLCNLSPSRHGKMVRVLESVVTAPPIPFQCLKWIKISLNFLIEYINEIEAAQF